MENWNSTNTNVRFIFVKRLEGGLEKPEEEELSSRRNMSRRKDPKKANPRQRLLILWLSDSRRDESLSREKKCSQKTSGQLRDCSSAPKWRRVC